MSFTYRGLKAEHTRHIVTGQEVDRQLERLRQQSPRITDVTDRPTQTGDEVVLDYAGFCDGQQFAGGTAKNQTLVLGSGTFIPGFEEQLLDKVPGQTVTVSVTFPKNYHAENLAGREAKFQCTIHAIRLKTPYDLDDAFAREVGGCENLDQLRRKTRESLQDYTDQRGELDLRDRLLRQAAQTLNFTPSESQIQAQLDQQMEDLKAQLSQRGLTLRMYCQFLSTTEEQLRQDARPDAEAAVRLQAAVEQIVSLENLTVSKEELGRAAARVCRQNNMTLEQLKPYYDAAFENALVRSVLTEKAMELVRDNAFVTVRED